MQKYEQMILTVSAPAVDTSVLHHLTAVFYSTSQLCSTAPHSCFLHHLTAVSYITSQLCPTAPHTSQLCPASPYSCALQHLTAVSPTSPHSSFLQCHILKVPTFACCAGSHRYHVLHLKWVNRHRNNYFSIRLHLAAGSSSAFFWSLTT